MLNNNYFGMEGIQEKGVWLKRKQVQKRVQRHCPVPRLLQILIKGGDDILPNWPFVLLLLVVLTKLWVLIRHTNMLRRLRKHTYMSIHPFHVNIYMQELKWKGGIFYTYRAACPFLCAGTSAIYFRDRVGCYKHQLRRLAGQPTPLAQLGTMVQCYFIPFKIHVALGLTY